MSEKIFTVKDIKQLSTNPYVKTVSSKAITYTDEFKQVFIAKNEKGKLSRDIFGACRFYIVSVGIMRVRSFFNRWLKA